MKSRELADSIYDLYTKSSACGLGHYSIEKALDFFYGKVVEDHVEVFKSVFKKLEDAGFTSRENSFCYGDADGYLWCEKLDDYTKLIICENVVTCADDNTSIFKLREFGDDVDTDKLLFEFKVITAFPEEVKKSDYWGDRRDYERVSLETYREHGFDFGCGDFRDNTHVLKMKYDISSNYPQIEDSHINTPKIKFFMDNLSWYDEIIE